MTRQMQWEVLHSECCARSSFAKRGEQVEPSNLLLTLCTAVKTSLRTVLTPCLHPGRMVRTLAQQATVHCQGVQQQLGRGWDTEEGNWGIFQHAQEPGGGHLWAGLMLVTNPLPLNITRTVTGVPCHSTMTPHRCLTTLRHGQSALTTKYPSKELKAGSSPRGHVNVLRKRRKTT